MEHRKKLTVTSAYFQENPDFSTLSFTFKSPQTSFNLSLGESKDIHESNWEIQLNSNLFNLSTTLQIQEIGDYNLQLSDQVSISLSIEKLHIHTPNNLSIHGLLTPCPTSCVYIQKLQEIEGEEREISGILYKNKMKAPVAYRDYFESSPQSSAKRSPLKKRTLDPEGFTQIQPDYQFSSYSDANLEGLSVNEPGVLKHAAFGLISKSQSLKPDAEEYEICLEVINDFEEPINNLKASISESKLEFEKELEGLARLKESAVKEEEEIAKEIEEVEQNNEGVRKEIEELREKISKMKGFQEKKPEGLTETQKLREQLEHVQREIQELEFEYASAEKEFNKAYPDQELAKTVNEKIMKLGELQRLVTLRDSAIQEGLLLSKDLVELEGLIEIQEDQILTMRTYKEEQLAYDSSNKHITLQLKEIIGESEENLEQSGQFLSDIQGSFKPLDLSLQEKTQNLIEKKDYSSDINSKLEDILKGNNQISLILDKEKQILNEYQEVRPQFDGLFLGHFSMANQLEFVSNSLLKVAENSITAGRLLRKTYDMVEEQELQQLSMHKLIALIKETKPAYIAVQGDLVDMTLAKHLNARHKTLDVGFKRLEKEKYSFGSLKVEIKLEEDIFVQYEGKKTGIEDFLEAFTQTEKEKLAKKPGVKISDKEKRPLAKIGRAPLVPLGQIIKKVSK